MMAEPSKFIGEISKSLGIPKNARWFELRCAVGEIVTVKVEYYPSVDEDEEPITERFELVKIDE